MRTAGLVATVVVTGVAGGVAGAALSRAWAPPVLPSSSRAAPSATVGAAFGDLRDVPGRVDAMEASLAGSGRELATLREALEKARAEAETLRGRIDELERAGPGDGPDARGLPVFRAGDAESVEARRQWAASMRNRQDLMRKSDEERWTTVREALTLTAHQEESLKSAIDTYAKAMKDAVVTREVTDRTGDDVVAIVLPDREKVQEARRAYDDAVSQALGPEQARRWRDEGYEAALRPGGIGATVRRAWKDASGDGGGR